MTSDPDQLINAFLDGTLTDEQARQFNDWIKADRAHAERFAGAASLHNRLADLVRARAALEPRQPVVESPRRQPAAKSWRAWAALCSAAASVAIVWLLFHSLQPDAEAAAEAQLKRLIETTQASGDRVYLITAFDEEPPKAAPSTDKRRKDQPPIHGARLYVRGPGQYVLIRRYEDGSTYITGSDGVTSWSVPPKGNVRISNDPLRFRGPVPGQQHDIPFLDIRASLAQLREAYELELLPTKPGTVPTEKWVGLRADKRGPEFRGPKRVEIWYVPDSGLIKQMWFDGLPRAKGGPRSMLVELISQTNLDANFYQHPAHHGNDRQVIFAKD